MNQVQVVVPEGYSAGMIIAVAAAGERGAPPT
jgi:hypothetical protein